MVIIYYLDKVNILLIWVLIISLSIIIFRIIILLIIVRASIILIMLFKISSITMLLFLVLKTSKGIFSLWYEWLSLGLLLKLISLMAFTLNFGHAILDLKKQIIILYSDNGAGSGYSVKNGCFKASLAESLISGLKTNILSNKSIKLSSRFGFSFLI